MIVRSSKGATIFATLGRRQANSAARSWHKVLRGSLVKSKVRSRDLISAVRRRFQFQPSADRPVWSPISQSQRSRRVRRNGRSQPLCRRRVRRRKPRRQNRPDYWKFYSAVRNRPTRWWHRLETSHRPDQPARSRPKKPTAQPVRPARAESRMAPRKPLYQAPGPSRYPLSFCAL